MTVPGFLTKTYEIFNNPEYSDCCGWGPNGDTIVIKKIDLFSKMVLPKYFKHGNYQSFVRQLNMYDFRKTMQDPTNGEFHHQYFIKNRPDLLVHIKRKAHGRAVEPTPIHPLPLSGRKGTSRSETAGKSKAYIPPEIVESETEMVLAELEQQTAMRNEIDKRLSALEKQHGQILNENMFLRNMVVESANKQAMMQERMEKIFRILYMYINGGGDLPQLANRAKQMLLTDLSSGSGINGIKYIEAGDSPSYDLNYLPGAGEVDDFELGLDLRHQTSFDSAAASVTAPSTSISSTFNVGQAGGPLERQPSIDYFLSSSPEGENNSTTTPYNMDPSIPGSSIRRLNSYTDSYRPSSARKRDSAASFEFTSDRVTELPALDADAQLKRPRVNSTTPLPVPVPEEGQSDPVQPQIDYLHLLQRNQETTMARMDSLEMTIQSLLDGVDFDDHEDSNWTDFSGVNNSNADSSVKVDVSNADDALKVSLESKNS